MGNNENWVSEQEQAVLFDRTDGGGEAIKLLEKNETNRDILNSQQGKMLIIARTVGNLGFSYMKDLCDEVEKVQMSVENGARKDFMKVAIEQWQGKLNTAKNNLKAMV
jgi:hypothetical protein